MRIVEVTTTDKEIRIGRQGENNACQICFSVAGWRKLYGNGTVALLHKRYGDAAPYPCAVNRDGDAVTWTITSADTARQGRGNAELQYRVGDTLVKSVMYVTKVDRALGDASDTPPEPYQSWVDQVLEAAQAGGASPEQIAAAVQAYLAEHPVEGTPGPAGADGQDGTPGEDGGYYAPSVDAEGNLSWAASKAGMPAVAAANIKGPKGDTGATGAPGPAGMDGEPGVDGAPGEDGYTPVRGVDYWTEDDIAAIKSYVDDAILGGAW